MLSLSAQFVTLSRVFRALLYQAQIERLNALIDIQWILSDGYPLKDILLVSPEFYPEFYPEFLSSNHFEKEFGKINCQTEFHLYFVLFADV